MKTPSDPALLLRTVEAFGTPTYAYFEDTIRSQCTLLRQHLQDLPFRLLYAMKANSNPAVLRVMMDEGVGVDAVSPAEVMLVRRLGLDADQILFSANNITDAEMESVQTLGVLFNIGEPSRLAKYGRAYPGSKVCIRLNPQIGAGHHVHVVTGGKMTKFGIPPAQIPDILDIARLYDLKIVGLHQHIGSGITDTQQLHAAIRILLELTNAFPDLEFLNFGGGFSIPYRATEHPIDIEHFEQWVVAPLRKFLKQRSHPISFWFEPGRFFVAESGVLLTRVNTLKTSGNRTFAGTDSGFNHLIRPILYDAYHSIYNLSNPTGPLQDYDIVGNICESGDIFAKDRLVQEIREGDVLAILDAGAYGASMASEYNLRALPAEVLIRTDGSLQSARPRLSSEALVDRYLQDTTVHDIQENL